MNTYSRYVIRQLLVGMVLVTASLTCVIWLSQSLRFVDMVINRGLSAGTFLYLTMLLLPNFLTIILPVALFLVVLFTYTKLINDQELVIMRAAGQSHAALVRPALIVALLVVAMGYLLNLYLLPESYRKFKDLKWDIRHNLSQVLLKEGTFNTIGNALTVYVRQRTPSGELLGILVHDTRKPKKPVTIMAERGAMVKSSDSATVVMFNGNRQEVDRKTNQMSILYFDKYSLSLGRKQAGVDIRSLEPREMNLAGLLNPKRNKAINPKDYGQYIMEAHKRLISPLSSIGFVLVALASVLWTGSSRRIGSPRIVFAVVIIIGLLVATLGVENLCAKNMRLIPLYYLVNVLPVVVGYALTVWSPWRYRSLRAAPSPGA